MNIILWALLGAVAGWLASIVAKTNDTQGTLGDIVLGVLGAVAGGWIMNALGEPGVTGFNLYSLLVAAGGALVLIFVSRAIRQ